jgi:integrase
MTKKGRQLEYQNFANRIFNPAVKKAGLKDVRIHDLRRTTATLLVAHRVDLKTIEAWMGHSDVRLTLGVYASHTVQGLANASTILAAALKHDRKPLGLTRPLNNQQGSGAER